MFDFQVAHGGGVTQAILTSGETTYHIYFDSFIGSHCVNSFVLVNGKGVPVAGWSLNWSEK